MPLALRPGRTARPSMRSSVIPAAAILVLLGLVFLLPKRGDTQLADGGLLVPGSAAAGRDVAEALLSLPRLELLQPPPYAVQADKDARVRNIERLYWGSNHVIERAREQLRADNAGLAEDLLARLQISPDSNPMLVAKLLAALEDGEPNAPGVVAELTRRSFSTSGLVAISALRVLGKHPSPDALAGILQRRNDPDLEVRAQARASLARRVQLGDEEALIYVLEDIELNPGLADLAYVTSLADAAPTDRVYEVLWRVADEGTYEARLIALGALLTHDDPEAERVLDEMIASEDLAARLNALRTATLADRIVARGQWERIVGRSTRQESLALMSMLARAVVEGDEEAPLASTLLERIATDPSHSCQVEALDVLLQHGHPWALERTKAEVREAVGLYLSQTVDRVTRVDNRFGPELAAVARERLESDPALDDVDRVLLVRLIMGVDREAASDLVVDYALADSGVLSRGMMPLVGALPPSGLARLAEQVGTDRGAGLYVYAAAQGAGGEALPVLETIVLDEDRDPAIRAQAFDAIARLRDGPREDSLRRLALELRDPRWTERARLLFWNYL